MAKIVRITIREILSALVMLAVIGVILLYLFNVVMFDDSNAVGGHGEYSLEKALAVALGVDADTAKKGLIHVDSAFWESQGNCSTYYGKKDDTLKNCIVPHHSIGGYHSFLRKECSSYLFQRCYTLGVFESVKQHPEILAAIKQTLSRPCDFLPETAKEHYYKENLGCFDASRNLLVSDKIVLGFFDDATQTLKFHIVFELKREKR